MSQPELSKGYAGSVNLDDEEWVVQVLTQSPSLTFAGPQPRQSPSGSKKHEATPA